MQCVFHEYLPFIFCVSSMKNDYDMLWETLLPLEQKEYEKNKKIIDIVGPAFRPLQMVKPFHQI